MSLLDVAERIAVALERIADTLEPKPEVKLMSEPLTRDEIELSASRCSYRGVEGDQCDVGAARNGRPDSRCGGNITGHWALKWCKEGTQIEYLVAIGD